MDNNGNPITLYLDMVNGLSPLIIVLYDINYADICKRSNRLTFSIKRPQDKFLYTLHTYTAKDDENCSLLILQIVPHENSPVSTLITTNDCHPYLTMAKRIHRFGHANAK